MKSASILLLLCATATALCQSAAPPPPDPPSLWKTPQAPVKPWMDFSKLPSIGTLQSLPTRRLFVVPEASDYLPAIDAQIDPKILVHPPLSKLGTLPSGTIIAKNEFPNLKFLPIALPGAPPHAIPAQWLGYGLEAIPTMWPKFKLSPVQGVTQISLEPPAK